MSFRVLILLSAVVLSACVQQSSEAPEDQEANDAAASTTTTLGRLGIEQATLEFVSCMRDQGIDVPDIRLDARGRPVLDGLRSAVEASSVEFRTALVECASILTRAGALDLRQDPELQAAIVGQLGAFAECVRSEGVEAFPDPDPAFSGLGSPFPTDRVPTGDPAFDAAVGTCQAALGSFVLGE